MQNREVLEKMHGFSQQSLTVQNQTWTIQKKNISISSDMVTQVSHSQSGLIFASNGGNGPNAPETRQNFMGGIGCILILSLSDMYIRSFIYVIRSNADVYIYIHISTCIYMYFYFYIYIHIFLYRSICIAFEYQCASVCFQKLATKVFL